MAQGVPMSPCSSYVLHGSYDTGTHPSVGLFQLAVIFFFFLFTLPQLILSPTRANWE